MSDFTDNASELEQQRYEAFYRNRPKTITTAVPAARDCIDCGEPISRKRLEAVPDCVRCVDCQEWLER